MDRADDAGHVSDRDHWTGERQWRGEVTYDGAPYGVGYLVATWLS